MDWRLFSRMIGLVSLVALTACGSAMGPNTAASGSNNSVAVGVGPSVGEPGTSQPDQIITVTSEGVTAHSGEVSIRVLWTVSGFVFGKDFTGDKQPVQVLLFKPLDINDTAIIFDGQSCQGVSFQEQTVKAVDYLASAWKETPQSLGIDVQELQVFKTDCSLPGFQEYMRLDDGRLIVPINGVFVFFEPTRNY